MKKLIGLAAAAALSVSGAHATTISTYTNSNYVSGDYWSQTYAKDGVTMKVTAGLYTDDAAATVNEGQYGARPVKYNNYGTGVSHNNSDGEHTVDGYIPEVLILAFDTTVKLTDLVFNYINSYGKFDFFIDSNDDGVLERVLTDIDLDGSYDSVSLTSLLAESLLTGKLFGVGTSYYAESCYYKWVYGVKKKVCETNKSEWKLKKVGFEEVPEVPLPAALPLFLAGIAGFGVAARKKRS
jgi:hypothetical protein